MPVAFDSVCVPAVVLPTVTRLPGVPSISQLDMVWVVPVENRKLVGCTLFDRVVKVLLPVIVSAPAPPLLRVQLYTLPPLLEEKVLALADVILMVPVPVPAVVVKPEANSKKAIPLPGQVSVPPLKVRFLVPLKPAVYSLPTVRLNPLRSIVPLVCVNARVEPIVSASSKRKVPPTPSKVSGKSRVLPLVLIVRGVPLVEANVLELTPALNVMPVDRVRSP